MKKILAYIMSIWIITGCMSALCLCIWQRVSFGWSQLSPDMTYYDSSYINQTDSETTNIWDHVSIKENENTIIVRLLWVFWLDTDNHRNHKFLDYAKAIINMALWLVAFIALIMTLYTFYMMFFSKNEEWIQKAKWNLIGIFIALAILWLAWLIVSFIFWWYQSNWQNNELLNDSDVSWSTYYYTDDNGTTTYYRTSEDGTTTYRYY